MKHVNAARTIDPLKLARERLARERGAAAKEHGGRLRVALAYPNTYRVGMSNLGFQTVYHLFNRREDVVCERVFLPSPREAAWLERHRKPLASLESATPLREFDAIAFSITFEHDYVNALAMLRQGGVDVHARPGARPRLLAGGLCPTLNPEAMAMFFDALLIGEAEGIVDPLLDALISRAGNDPLWLAGSPGAYLTQGDNRRVARVWSSGAFGHTRIYTPDTVFGDMWLVETGKGCGQHCRFCAAGYAYRPTRHAPIEWIESKIDEGLRQVGKVGLVGSAVADHPDFERMLEHIARAGGRAGVSSLRLDRFTPRLVELLHKVGEATVTVAPEAGAEPLRLRINKDLRDEQIYEAARDVFRAAPSTFKMYFLVGLPGETDDDARAIVEMVKNIQRIMVDERRPTGEAGRISVSVNGFVPKPFTPFERMPFAGVKTLSARLRIVTEELKSVPNVTVAAGSPRLDYAQTVMSVGGRDIGPLIEAASLSGWAAALRETTLDLSFVERGRAPGEPLPWGRVDWGMAAGYLEKECGRFERCKVTPPCPPPGSGCTRCGQFPGVCS